MSLLFGNSLCSRFDPFHRYDCLAPIDFSNCYLRRGLAPKPARSLNDDSLYSPTWPSLDELMPARPCDGTFCVSVETGGRICDTRRGRMSNSSVLNHKDTCLSLINVFVGSADVRASRCVWTDQPIAVTWPKACSYYTVFFNVTAARRSSYETPKGFSGLKVYDALKAKVSYPIIMRAAEEAGIYGCNFRSLKNLHVLLSEVD